MKLLKEVEDKFDELKKFAQDNNIVVKDSGLLQLAEAMVLPKTLPTEEELIHEFWEHLAICCVLSDRTYSVMVPESIARYNLQLRTMIEELDNNKVNPM